MIKQSLDVGHPGSCLKTAALAMNELAMCLNRFLWGEGGVRLAPALSQNDLPAFRRSALFGQAHHFIKD